MAALLTVEHLTAVVAVAVAAVLAGMLPRAVPGPWTDVARRSLAAALVVIEASWWVYVATGGVPGSSLATSLPLQLCDVAILVAAAALWTQRRLLVDLAYFWGLAGSTQALLTPDLQQHFPTYPYLQYYLAHGGVVVAAVFMVAGLGLVPRPFAALRIGAITLAYAAIVGLVDALTGANYMYLRAKPPAPTLLDAMGPWPWYIGAGAVIAIALLAALELPLHARSRRPVRRV